MRVEEKWIGGLRLRCVVQHRLAAAADLSQVRVKPRTSEKRGLHYRLTLAFRGHTRRGVPCLRLRGAIQMSGVVAPRRIYLFGVAARLP